MGSKPPSVNQVPQRPLTAAEQRADAICWSIFVASFSLGLGVLIVLVVSLWEDSPAGGKHRGSGGSSGSGYSLEYFVLCMIGGVLSGLPHTMLTPVDLVKCRVQCGEYTSFKDGITSIWREGIQAASAYGSGSGSTSSPPNGLAGSNAVAPGGIANGATAPHTSGTCFCCPRSFWGTKPGSWILRLALFYQGWAPTLIGYSFQGALKFALYEYFKHFIAHLLGYRLVLQYRVLVFLSASMLAEFVADIMLSPWEAIKIKMQTTRLYPPYLRVVIPRMFAMEGLYGAFFKGLVPLWVRQVPYTMMKFASFEQIVGLLYSMLRWWVMWTSSPSTASGADDEVTTKAAASGSHHPSSQDVVFSPTVQLCVSLVAGCLAGMLCAIISHPADTLVSKLNQRTGSGSAASPASATNGDDDDLKGPPPGSNAGGGGTWALVKEIGWKGLWNGLGLRMVMIGSLTALQWLIYDSFKVAVGLQTTAGAGKK